MTELRSHLESLLADQPPHPVWPAVEVLWSEPLDAFNCTMRLGPLVERVSLETLARRISERKRLIHLSSDKGDPLRYSCEADIWRQIDLEMCKKRLAHPGAVLEVLVTGGIRPGKTEGATRRGVAHFCFTEGAWVWGLHETDITSGTIQQPRVFKFLPPEMKPDTGKMRRDIVTKFNFGTGGFTGNSFNIPWDCQDETGRKFTGGGLFEFRFYKQDPSTLQGSELTFAMSDELVPPSVVESVRERLLSRAQDTAQPAFLARIRQAQALLGKGEPLPIALLGALYHGVHVITFTPKEGWNATISSFLGGAKKYAKVPAELLPDPKVPASSRTRADFGWFINGKQNWPSKDIIGYELVPRFAQPVMPTRLVAYMHTYDNPFKGNWPGMRQITAKLTPEEKRVLAYGDVDKDWMVQFPNWSEDKHVITLAQVPRQGTVEEIIDPSNARPWCMAWCMTDEVGKRYVLQEWPPCEEEVPGLGVLGEWAIPSRHEKRNGDVGPAQRINPSWSWLDYTVEIWRQRKRLYEKFAASGGRPFIPGITGNGTDQFLHALGYALGGSSQGEPFRGRVLHATLSWTDLPGFTLEGPFIMPERSQMDSRFGSAPTPSDGGSTTLIEEMLKQEHAIEVEPASGGRLAEGDSFIKAALRLDPNGIPGLFVVDDCKAVRFALATYSLPPFAENTQKKDEACKDPRDCVAMYLLGAPEHVTEEDMECEGGGSY